MPGKAVEFTYNTVICVEGESGKGKTTLCKFLKGTNDKIRIISLDKFYSCEFINSHFCDKKSNKYVGDLDTLCNGNGIEFLKFLKTFKEPTTENVSIITNNAKFNARLFNNLLNAYICSIFKRQKTNLLLIEGYTMKFISKYINSNDVYIVWKLR
jgi:uridine kinase